MTAYAKKCLPQGVQWPDINLQIQRLQLATCEEEFSVASQLLLKEWSIIQGMEKFSKYFNNVYCSGPLSRWHEGSAPCFVSNNNGVERFMKVLRISGKYEPCLVLYRFNRIIKVDYTLHEKKAIDIFVQTLERAVKERSEKLQEPVALHPEVDPKVLTAAQLVGPS